jgi:hypothetical protein
MVKTKNILKFGINPNNQYENILKFQIGQINIKIYKQKQ